MRAMKRLLSAVLVLMALGAACPALAGQDLDSSPPTADWRFAGPRIRPQVQVDSLWDILFPVWEASFLSTLFHSGWF